MAHLKNMLLTIFLHFCVTSSTFAQSNTYFVYFKDKHGTTGSIHTPNLYLSARSLQKRMDQHIQIDSTDLPVSSTYLNGLKDAGAEICYSSKWMNAACIKASTTVYDQILLLPFIKHSSSNFTSKNNDNTKKILGVQQNNYAQAYTDFLGIDYMHAKGIKGKGVLIAITDSGFPGVDTLSAFKHLWNNQQIIYSYDIPDNNTNVYNDDSHGTYMLSILAANATNYLGIAPEADYVLLRTEIAATESVLEEYNWLRAAEISDSCGVDIISVSLGYTTYDQATDSYTYSNMDGKTSVIAQAANMAYEKGMIVVCSAGNDGEKYWKYIGTPADAKHVLAVGSVDSDKIKSRFSSFGPSADGRIKPDLCALGQSVFCFKPDGSLFSTGGTSLATPMIAGMLAGMKQAFPKLSNDVLKQILLQSCDHYSNPNNEIGHGVPYFNNIYSFASIYNQESDFLIAPNPYYEGRLVLKLPTVDEQYEINIFDSQGRLLVHKAFVPQSNIMEIQDWVLTVAQGMYFISIDSSNKRETHKWIKL